MTDNTHTDSYHPGPPRFVQVGERIVDPIYVDMAHGYDRDNLAPTIAGTPERDPGPYDRDDFQWRLLETPDESDVALEYAPTPYDERTQYDEGLHNTVEFQPDAPGIYRLELDAPDGTHELTIEAFPTPALNDEVEVFDIEGEIAGGAGDDIGGPPHLELVGEFDAEAGEFVVESNLQLATDAFTVEDDLTVSFQPHDAASLDREDITVEGATARIPIGAVDEPTSLFAAPYDGVQVGATDEIVLDPDGEIEYPNRPPEWLDDAVMYEIFPRSFGGEASEADFEFLTEKVDYLAELGVDVVWLTPIVPAWSATVDTAPGGPHGYSTGDYFDVAPDLGTLADFEAFIDACHEEDIRVCFDLVVNHCGWTNEKWQDTIAELGDQPEDPYAFPGIEVWDTDSPYFDWFDRQTTPSEEDAGPAQTSVFNVRLQPNLNYGNMALREHILAAVDFWSEYVDAFRCDIAWGVPHSFWKEARRLTRQKDAEFMWLDESIPYLTSMGESEFDLHFDTTEFMFTAHSVARGERPPSDLLDAIDARAEHGFPTYSRILNTTENHDESRVYWEAKANGHREDPAQAERAALATAFTLPGVPFLYYGQERLIAEYGTRRESPFADRNDRFDDIEKDPYKRAFMNWDLDDLIDDPDEADTESPAEARRAVEKHLEFVSDLADFYHDSPVFGPAADLVREAHRTDATDDVLVFGRDAGDEKRVVAINFAPEPQRIQLRPTVETRDRFSGEDLAVGSSSDAATVEVETLAVFETDSLFGQGN